MPTFGGANADSEVENEFPTFFPGIRGQLQVTSQNVAWDAFPLTFDYGFDSANEQANLPIGLEKSLADITSGNEWRLRRIVGKCFIHALADETDDPATQTSLCDVALGFMVCNTDDDGTPTTNFDEVNPLAQESMEDPWIWRRRWVLNPYGNMLALNFQNNIQDAYGAATYPQTNAGYGSAVDGPHIDQKTARRIHRQQRLFAIIATRAWSDFESVAVPIGTYTMYYNLDYRLLGSIGARAVGNRGFAAR